MRTFVPILLAGLLGSLVVPAQASGEREASYQLYRLSGFRAQFAPALGAIGRVGSSAEACQQRLAQRVAERFDTVAIQAIADFPDADRARLIEWFESDLGRAEAAANAQLAAAYPGTSDLDMQRLQLIEKLLDTSALPDSAPMLPSSAALMSLPASENKKLEADKAGVEKDGLAGHKNLSIDRQSLIKEAAYRYRQVSTPDLQLIAQRSSEPAHRAFKQAMHSAASDVLDLTLRDIGSGALRCHK